MIYWIRRRCTPRLRRHWRAAPWCWEPAPVAAEPLTQELLEPREAAARALEESGPVAVVFGCEKSGLDNAALDRCHALVGIPTGVDYMSLNLSQAVQVLCYELHMTARVGGEAHSVEARVPATAPATAERMEVFFDRLERTLAAIRFSTPGPDRNAAQAHAAAVSARPSGRR